MRARSAGRLSHTIPALVAVALASFAGCTGGGGKGAGDATPAPAALAGSYRAHGNEPSWGLVIEADSMKFVSPGAAPLAAPLPSAEVFGNGRRYQALVNGAPFTVTIVETPCADVMSGMPYPHAVAVQLSGVEYRGCGGDPAALLTGEEWVVESIDGIAIAPGPGATLSFGADGRVTGSTSCNRYTGGYRLSGEGLSFAEAASTRRACEAPLMEQEQRFLAALIAVDRFELGPDGALIMSGGVRHRIVARRQEAGAAGPAGP